MTTFEIPILQNLRHATLSGEGERMVRRTEVLQGCG
jgi:hypothetical protein